MVETNLDHELRNEGTQIHYQKPQNISLSLLDILQFLYCNFRDTMLSLKQTQNSNLE